MNKLLRYKLGAEGANVFLWQIVKPSDSITEIYTNEWIDFVGEYPQYPLQNLQVLELIAQEIALQYPERPDKRISVLDASGQDCPNHVTHSCWPPLCLDIQYFTLGANNHTQWPGPVVEIWTDGNLNGNSDVERNAVLVKLLYDCFSDVGRSTRILMHTKIRNALIAKAKEWWPEKRRGPFVVKGEWRNVQASIQDFDSLNHDLHMHTMMQKINFEAQI